MQFYLGQISRERKLLIEATCGDIAQEHNARKTSIYAKFDGDMDQIKRIFT